MRAAMRNKLLFGSLSLLLTLFGCKPSDPYSHYESIKKGEWSRDSWLAYALDSLPVDPQLQYDVILGIVNSNQYPYRNLWLRISQNFNDTVFVNDTIEIKLADENGKWIGSGSAGLYQFTVPYKNGIRLDSTRSYSIHIRQVMKDNPLKGIDKVGVMVKRS